MAQHISPYHAPDFYRDALAKGRHRDIVGGRWEETGRAQMALLLEAGLLPHHLLLDIGAGSLRLGCKAVPYLDPGHYWATDQSGALMARAKELSVPIVALSQLSRQVEQREDKRPQLSDLRESGSIEQDADCVMFVYRESYYLGRAEPREGSEEHLQWQQDMDRLQGQAEVVIGKQRHGPIGIVKLAFDADTVRFGNLAHGYEEVSYE